MLVTASQLFELFILVYPSLDASDDEDLRVFKPRGKRRAVAKESKDEAWSPRARMSMSRVKTDRPQREGTKKEAVEKGLEHAASKVNTAIVSREI